MSLKKNFRALREFLTDVPVIGPVFVSHPKVAVIRLSGVITDTGTRRQNISAQKYEKLIEDAFDVHHLKAVALSINCPGGAPAQAELIGNHIRRLAAEKDIPVYSFVEDIAASGGYWLACAADTIFAQQTSIVGSVGVISASFGFQDLIEKHGIERRVHTAGKDKSFLDPFLAEKPDDIKRLQSIQANIHGIFKDWVRERRGHVLKGSDKDLFEGQFWTAEDAIALGIIDNIGDIQGVFRDKFGPDIKFVEFGPDKKWISSLLGADLSLSRDAISTLEERSIWARYGL
jgi:signal peptide peptidase SppA